MREAAPTFTEQHLLLSTTLTVLAVVIFGIALGLGVATVGVRAVEMTLGLP